MKKLAYSLFLLLYLCAGRLSAYESEERLKTAIVGKLAQYIQWQEPLRERFVITILGRESKMPFKKIYFHKRVKSRPVEIRTIDRIDELQASQILFISKSNQDDLRDIFAYLRGKNILSISDKRGFAQKGGMVQLYFLGQELKIKMNIATLQEEGFGIDRTLLKIVDIAKRDR